MFAGKETTILLEKLISISDKDEIRQIALAIKENFIRNSIELEIFNNILHDDNVAICVIDINKKVILFNKAAETITGISQEDILGEKLSNRFFISEDIFDNLMNKTSTNQKKLNFIQTMLLRNKSDEDVFIKISASPVCDIKNKLIAIQFTFHDISNEFYLKKENSIQIQRYKTLLELSDNMFFLKDRHLRYIYLSNDYLAYNKLTQDTIINKTDQDIFEPNAAKIYTESDISVLSSKNEVVIEGFRDKNQIFKIKKSPIYLENKIIGLAGVIINITNETDIADKLQLLASAIDQIMEGILITDSNSKIIYVNSGYSNICGYSKDELIGNNPSIVSSGKMSGEYYGIMWDTLKQGKIWHNTFINKKKNGDIYEEDVVITPILDSYDNITHYIAIKKDVTKENISNRQLQHSAKLESLGTLAGGIAHDFNNILSIILGYTELIKESVSENSNALEDLNEIINASNRAKEIIRQILLFSRQKESEKSILKIEDVFAGIEKSINATIPVNIKFIFSCKSNSYVFMESSHVLQILINLTSNSIQAIDKSLGVISLKVTDIKRSQQDFELQQKMTYDEYVHIKFTDNGCGINDIDMQKIFDPYFTTKDLGENTGLGLSVIDGIVRSVDGFITVRSEIGKGTEFNIFIPTVKPEDKEIKQKESTIDYPKNLKILLIDDESSIVYAITKILNKYGFMVYGFKTSKEAIDYYYNNREIIDLVITDYLIPVKNGIEIIKELRQINPGIPCIVISGNLKMMFDNHQDIPKTNIIYLDKPFESITLLKAINRIMNP